MLRLVEPAQRQQRQAQLQMGVGIFRLGDQQPSQQLDGTRGVPAAPAATASA
jgi:hypothetical protein